MLILGNLGKNLASQTSITYEVEGFTEVIDWLLQELYNRFNEKNSQLLVSSAAFSLRESFCDFNVESLVSLAKLYPDDFSSKNLRDLRDLVNMYIDDVREDEVFSNLNNIGELAQKMVQTRKKLCYALGLSTFKACISAAGCYSKCREMLFVHEACEDIFV
jgi:hypothetical protein